MSRPFLEHIRIDSFGSLGGRVVGPFSPGMNVVFGPNEAGKTTLASFVGGVLFGWREARGSANTYKPANGERAGSLFFAVPREGAEGEGAKPGDAEAWDEVELSRARNADGLVGDASLVDDIDKETFQIMFSLTSDQLRSLRNTSDVTAKLLTAGSGTGASPAHALATVDERLAGYTSRAAGAEHSLVNIAAEKDELRAQISAASDEADRCRRDDEEFRELAPQRDEMARRLSALNDEIESLTDLRVRVEKLDAEIAGLEEDLAALADDEAELEEEGAGAVDEDIAPLMGLGSSDERALRDAIDDLAAEETRCDHAVELAQDRYSTSKAAYDVLQETRDEQKAASSARRQRTAQVALSIVLPVSFIVAGVYLFIHGRAIASLSYTMLGAALLLFAAFLAAGALVMLLRPDQADDELKERRENAEWVMRQDKKKLEACIQSRDETKARTRAELDRRGLSAARGSIRQARELLDEAREARSAESLRGQRRQSMASRRSKLEANLTKARAQRRRLFESADFQGDRDIAAIDAALDQKSQQREGLLEASQSLDRRYGELKQELSQAEHLQDFDELKLRYQQLQTREREAYRDYATLLLAKRMLESAIAKWESKSQPEVYRQASRLLSLMTGGRWTKVEMTEEGRLQVTDAVKTKRDPTRLSMGTCQQLYLALRIALLMEADNVGRAVPILADDILVNFDADRRVGAAKALAELAGSRQIILFTCHEEVVEALRGADPGLREIRL